MARYRTKDPVDLAWNKIRRAITMEVDRLIKDKREEILNDLLGPAFTEFSAGLQRGEVKQLEAGDEKFIRAKIEEALSTSALGLSDAAAD